MFSGKTNRDARFKPSFFNQGHGNRSSSFSNVEIPLNYQKLIGEDLTDDEIRRRRLEKDKKNFKLFQSKEGSDFYEGTEYNGGLSNSGMRVVLLGGCFLIGLALALFAVIWAVERNSYVVSQGLPGPRGPPGFCNLSQGNQTFIAGFMDFSGDVRVGEELFFGNDEASMYVNDSCFVFNSTLPLCVDSGIATNDIMSPPGTPLNVKGSPVVLHGNVNNPLGNFNLNQGNLTIGGVTFYYNGTHLDVIGNTTFTNLPLSIPLTIDGTGTIGPIPLNGTTDCLAIQGSQCLYLDGPLYFGPNFSFANPFVFTNNVTIADTLLIGSHGGITSTNNDVTLFSNNHVTLTANDNITLIGDVITFDGEVNFENTITSDVTLGPDNSLTFQCSPGPVTASLGFQDSPDCNCLSFTSDSGLCLNSNSADGINLSGLGNVVVNGPMDLEFASGAGIQGSPTINGSLTVSGDLSVNQDLTVDGSLNFQDLTVSGNAVIQGNIDVLGTQNNIVALNTSYLEANILRTYALASFFGQGASLDAGTTLFVGGKLSIATLQSGLRCNSPIFRPDTINNPTTNPCVPECTDMQRCNHVIKTLHVTDKFEVGVTLAPNLTASVRMGIMNGKKLTNYQINTEEATINSSTPIKILSDVTITGDILAGPAGVDPHPCCTGEQINKNNRVVLVGFTTLIPGIPIPIATSEVTVIPFSVIHNPTSSLATAFNPITHLFVAPFDGSFSFTVSLSLDPSESAIGTIRGITMKRDFQTPIANSAILLRICIYPNGSIVSSPFMQITCTYTGYFQSGDTASLLLYHDGGGSLNILGDLVTSYAASSRLEIYALS